MADTRRLDKYMNIMKERISTSHLAFAFLCFMQASGKIITMFPSDTDAINDIISQMTKDIIRKYYYESYCIGVVVEEDSTLRHVSVEIPIVLVRVSKIPAMDDSETYGNLRNETLPFDNLIVQLLEQRCIDIIIQVSNPQYLVEYFSRSSRRSDVRLHRTYLYLPLSGTLGIKNPDAALIFHMKEMYLMPDLVIINALNISCTSFKQTEFGVFCNEGIKCAQNDSLEEQCKYNEFELLTHRFVGPNPAEVVKLNKWTYGSGFEKGEDLFPNKMKNLEGKPLVVSAIEYPPYTITNRTIDPAFYEGIEFRIVKEYAKFLNASLEVEIDDEAMWGEVWPNGSGNGMWGMVAMDTAVIGFGATYGWLENYPYLDYSLPYIGSSVLCVTPRPRHLPNWKTPMLPFTKEAWLAVAISLLITTIVFYLVSKAEILLYETTAAEVPIFSTPLDSLIRTLGMLLLVTPQKNSILNPPMRHLLTWFMLFFLIINSLYTSGLASLLTIPRFEDPINTPQDLANSGLIWAATVDAWIYSIQEATEPHLTRIVQNYRTMSEEELLQKALNHDKIAFGVERLPNRNIALPSYLTEDALLFFRAMREDIYSGDCVFNLRKGSPFLDSLNTLVLRLHAAGLILYYEVQVVREFEGQQRQLILEENDEVTTDPEPVKLNIAHIEGPIFLLSFGLLIAFVVLLNEKLQYKLALSYNKRKMRKLANVMKAKNKFLSKRLKKSENNSTKWREMLDIVKNLSAEVA